MPASKPDILVQQVDASGVALDITDSRQDMNSHVADGGDVALGATRDEPVEGDTRGTISAKLGGVNKAIWSILGRLARFGAPGSPTTDVVTVQGTPWMTPVATSLGEKTVAHGSNPAAVPAGERAELKTNRHGVPFGIGGHPNIITQSWNYTAAQTDTALVTVAAGVKVVVTRAIVVCHKANSVNVSFRLGFGAANVPAYAAAGLVLTHPGAGAGEGIASGTGGAILGVGADGEDLRFTCAVPTGGSIDITVSYFTIES